MPYTFTTADRELVESGVFSCFQRLWLTDPNGDWVFVGMLASDLGGPHDFQIAAELSHHVDAHTYAFTALVARQHGTLSLSPYRFNSPLNADSTGVWAPFLDVRRYWMVDQVVMLTGMVPDDTNYVEMGRGIVDEILVNLPANTINLVGRGLEGELMDATITDPTFYGNDAVPVPLATVLQQMLDDWGPGGYTVVEDDPALFDMVLHQVARGNLWPAMAAAADKASCLLEVLPGAIDGEFDVRITKPNLTPVGPDYTIEAYTVTDLPTVATKLESVRTVVRLTYESTTGGRTTIQRPTVLPSVASTRYGVRILDIDLSAETQVTADTPAGDFADRVLSDVQFPTVEYELTVPGLWWVKLRDYVKLTPDYQVFDDDQYGAIQTYTKRWENHVLKTKLGMRGQPSLRYQTWIDLGRGGSGSVASIVDLSASFQELNTGLARLAGIQYAGTVNKQTRSVRVRISEDPTFATSISDTTTTLPYGTVDFANLVPLSTAQRDKTFYVQATPYSGPALGGVMGTPLVRVVYTPALVPVITSPNITLANAGTTFDLIVTKGPFAESLKIEISADPTFATSNYTPFPTYYQFVLPADVLTYSDFVPVADFGLKLYARLTPYTGPLVAGLPTGSAGAPVVIATVDGMVNPTTQLLPGGAAAGDILVFDGTNWLPEAPVAPSTERSLVFPFGNGATMGAAGDWLALMPGFDFTAARWKVRALKADRSQATLDATFTVKKVEEAGGALVDLGGGTLTLSGVSEASGCAAAWANKACLENDEIVVTLETLTNPNAITSLVFTLTVET
jgi:hypothetical protein